MFQGFSGYRPTALERVEAKELVLKVGDVERHRYYDAVMMLDGKEIRYEVKAWDPKSIQDFLYLSFKGAKKDQVGKIQ